MGCVSVRTRPAWSPVQLVRALASLLLKLLLQWNHASPTHHTQHRHKSTKDKTMVSRAGYQRVG